MYKQSFYNVFLKKEDGYIVYNTFSGAIAKIEEETYFDLHKNVIDGEEKYFKVLKENGFIISQDIDEKKIMEFDRSREIYGTEVATFRILTTTNCNAKCFYCYEDTSCIETMDIKTAEQVIKFIIDRTINCKKIQLQWFGGEPLLNASVIEVISLKLNEYFQLRNVEVQNSIITNALLINDQVIKSLVLCKINKIQISIDGDNEEYVKRKGLSTDKDYLSLVLGNVKKLLEHNIKVSIRLNYDNDNIDSIENLIDNLGKQFREYSNLRVYPYPLFGTYLCEKKLQNSTSKTELLKLLKSLEDAKLINKNKILNLKYRKGRCFACATNSFVIAPNGDLYKCTIDMKNSVGNIWDGVILNKTFFEWCNASVDEKCGECKYLPLCQGGCKAGQIGKNSVTCFLYKEIIEDIVNANYE